MGVRKAGGGGAVIAEGDRPKATEGKRGSSRTGGGAKRGGHSPDGVGEGVSGVFLWGWGGVVVSMEVGRGFFGARSTGPPRARRRTATTRRRRRATSERLTGGAAGATARALEHRRGQVMYTGHAYAHALLVSHHAL